uniref:Uncharacterized protein n=1 Tax=Strigamia maritima TaxID=126957 RepID=T1IHZ7_STRMM
MTTSNTFINISCFANKDNNNQYIQVNVNLTQEELNFCYSTAKTMREVIYVRDLDKPETITFIGEQRKTKHTLSLKMYDEEVKEWLEEAAEEERFPPS